MIQNFNISQWKRSSLSNRLIFVALASGFLIAFLSIALLPFTYAWKICSISLTVGFGSAAFLLNCLHEWESTFRERVALFLFDHTREVASPPQKEEPLTSKDLESQEEQGELIALNQEISKLRDSLKDVKQKKEHYKNKCDSLEQNFHQDQEHTIESTEHKERLIGEYQQTIVEQREVIEEKQQEVDRLECRVQDLTFEVKTLLQLPQTPSHAEPMHPVVDLFDSEEQNLEGLPIAEEKKGLDQMIQTPFDAAVTLKKYVKIAEDLTGASHLSHEESRLLDFSMDHYAIDLRRLFDYFRGETHCILLLYSQLEKKLMFVNQHSKEILGWSSDKFLSDFKEIVREGFSEWKYALTKLQNQQEAQTRLTFKHKDETNVLMHASLGKIARGSFKGNVVVVLYPS